MYNGYIYYECLVKAFCFQLFNPVVNTLIGQIVLINFIKSQTYEFAVDYRN